MIPPSGFSKLQIFLHWAVALMILAQFLFSDPMNAAARAVGQGAEPVVGTMVWQHILFGLLILAFTLWRIAVRHTRGMPAPVGPKNPIQDLVANLTQAALYIAMILLPVTGLLAWYGGVEAAETGHQLAKMALLAFLALHVAGAFYSQLVLKNGLIWRMIRADD